MAFHFRLQTVLNYRHNLEEQLQLQLGRERRLLEEQRQQLVDMHQQRKQTIEAFEERKKKTLAAVYYSLFFNALTATDAAIGRQERTIASQQQVIERLRKQLLEKVRDRKVMERLREKDYQQYLESEKNKELKEYDELAVLRYGRTDSLLR